jgi:hypothetical protein
VCALVQSEYNKLSEVLLRVQEDYRGAQEAFSAQKAAYEDALRAADTRHR